MDIIERIIHKMEKLMERMNWELNRLLGWGFMSNQDIRHRPQSYAQSRRHIHDELHHRVLLVTGILLLLIFVISVAGEMFSPRAYTEHVHDVNITMFLPPVIIEGAPYDVVVFVEKQSNPLSKPHATSRFTQGTSRARPVDDVNFVPHDVRETPSQDNSSSQCSQGRAVKAERGFIFVFEPNCTHTSVPCPWGDWGSCPEGMYHYTMTVWAPPVNDKTGGDNNDVCPITLVCEVTVPEGAHGSGDIKVNVTYLPIQPGVLEEVLGGMSQAKLLLILLLAMFIVSLFTKRERVDDIFRDLLMNNFS